MACRVFFVWLYVLGRGRRTYWQPMGPHVDTTTITAVMRTNRVDSGGFSARCCAFRRTHTSVDPIWLLCIRLVLPLTLSLPSDFAPRARLMVCASSRTLWPVGAFTCNCKLRDERGGAFTATMTVGVSSRALWLAGIFLHRKKRCAGIVGTRTDWVWKREGAK